MSFRSIIWAMWFFTCIAPKVRYILMRLTLPFFRPMYFYLNGTLYNLLFLIEDVEQLHMYNGVFAFTPAR